MTDNQPANNNQHLLKEPLPPELQQVLEGLMTAGSAGPEGVEIVTSPEHIIQVLTALKEKAVTPYNMLTDICGVDLGDDLQVVYRLYQRYSAAAAVIKVTVPRATPRLPTATGLWKIAAWPEREIAEMFGITFEDHPDPRHLLLPDDFEGYPLRKDYQYPEDHPYLKPDPTREELGADESEEAEGTDEFTQADDTGQPD